MLHFSCPRYVHFTQRRNFHVFARVPPIDVLRLDPDVYRVAVGVIELSCVAAILFLQPRLQVLGCYILLLIMVGALYSHYSIGDPLKEMGGAIFGLAIVLARLYTGRNLYYELKLKET